MKNNIDKWLKYGMALLVACVTCVHVHAQDKTIQGVVLSEEDGQPLIGVSVFFDKADLESMGIHTPKGTITNIDGDFNLSVPKGINRFYCSYLGFKTKEVKMDGKNKYKVFLSPTSQQLDAVVVTGYQNIEKRKLTASVSKLKIADNITSTATSIDQALSGQVAGLQAMSTSGTPGAPMKIRIRGASSLSGSSDPLWVLDGIPLENTNLPKLENLYDVDEMSGTSLAGINPSDIESITVLKDAAATAIYGARAANGVIVITTKKGKQGKPLVRIDARVSFLPKMSLNRLNLMNSKEKVGLELDLIRNKYPNYKEKGEVYKILNAHNAVKTLQEQGYDALPQEVKKDIEALNCIDTDWNDVIFRNAWSQNYHVNISGANEKANYYTTIGYTDDMGNVKGYESSRINFLSKNSYRLTDKLTFGLSLVASRRKDLKPLTGDNGTTNPLYYSRRANPYQRVFDENGEYVLDYNISNSSDTSLGFNVVKENDHTSNTEIANSFSAIFDGKYLFNDDWKISTQLGLQLDKNTKEKIAYKDTYYMLAKRQNAKYYDRTLKAYKNFLPDGGMHYSNESSNRQLTWKTMLEYKHIWKDKHDLQAMVGSEIRKTYYDYVTSTAYGFDPVTLTVTPVIFPDESKARKFPLHNTYRQENAYASFFSTFSYSYDSRYTLGGSVRMDGSDLYGVAKKYRFLPLYSVSGLWRISNEKWMKTTQNWLSNLDVRASFGIQGNIDKNTSPFLIGTYDNVSILPGGTEHFIRVDNAPNAKLRWEKTYSSNFGLDVSLFNDRVSATIDYYYRKGVDLIGLKMLPWETGFTSSTINWASMSNEGLEVSLNTTNVRTKNFTWNTTFNFAYNKNKVLRETVNENETTPSREGYSESAIFALKTAGLDKDGYPLFVNKKGEKVSLSELYQLNAGEWGIVTTKLTPQQQRALYTYIGDEMPPFTGGLFNTFTYKNWDLNINMNYNFGGYVRVTPTYNAVNFDKGGNSNRDILYRWTSEHSNTKYSALFFNENRQMDNDWYSGSAVYNHLDTWVKPLNYIRLQSIRLGYTLPQALLKKSGIESAKVSLEVANLGVISSDYTNYLDPESMGNPYATPLPKSVSLSVSMSF